MSNGERIVAYTSVLDPFFCISLIFCFLKICFGFFWLIFCYFNSGVFVLPYTEGFVGGVA